MEEWKDEYEWMNEWPSYRSICDIISVSTLYFLYLSEFLEYFFIFVIIVSFLIKMNNIVEVLIF